MTGTLPARHPDLLDGLLEQIAGAASDRDRDGRLPVEHVAALAQRGFGTSRLPEADGGAGLSVVGLTEQLLRLAEADSNFVQLLRSHFVFVEALLLSTPSDERSRWLREIAGGALIGGAYTERSTTNSNRFSTEIIDTDEGTVLRGRKYYSTGSAYADWISATAEHDGEIESVLVARTATGVLTPNDWDGFGQRLTASGSTIFADVPEAQLHTSPIDSDAGAYVSAFAQLFHLISLAGIARSATVAATEYVRSRQRYFSHGSGQLPQDDPLVRSVLGELSANDYLARTVVLSLAEDVDRLFARYLDDPRDAEELGTRVETDVFRGQVLVVRAALDSTTRMFEVGGASALSRDKGWDRLWRNARTLASHNPLSIRLNDIGAHELTGQPSFRAWLSGVDLRDRTTR